MKSLTLGLLLLAALTGFSMLGSADTASIGLRPPEVVVPQPAPRLPENPQWTVQPIPTDGWQSSDEPLTR